MGCLYTTQLPPGPIYTQAAVGEEGYFVSYPRTKRSTPATAWTQIAQSGVQHTNHKRDSVTRITSKILSVQKLIYSNVSLQKVVHFCKNTNASVMKVK